MPKRIRHCQAEHKSHVEPASGVAPEPAFNGRAKQSACRCSLRFAPSMVLLAGLAATAPPAQAARYEFDQRRTEVRFAYKMALATHRGRFTKVAGVLDYDDKSPAKSKVTASVAAASLTTGDALIDSQLKGSQFFNVESAPVIAFKSIKVQPHSTTAAVIAGEVTIKGITQRVLLKVRIKPHDDPALKFDTGSRRFIATTRIRRSAFNMTAYENFVEDDVDLVIDAIVRPKKRRRKRTGR